MTSDLERPIKNVVKTVDQRSSPVNPDTVNKLVQIDLEVGAEVKTYTQLPGYKQIKTHLVFEAIYLILVLIGLTFWLVRSSLKSREVRHKAHIIKVNRHIKHRKLTLFDLDQV